MRCKTVRRIEAVKTGVLAGVLMGAIALPLQAHEMPDTSVQDFQKVEQSAVAKIAVTLFGLGLLGAELWWFLGNHRPNSDSTTPD